LLAVGLMSVCLSVLFIFPEGGRGKGEGTEGMQDERGSIKG
jgi:hypothetical protein